MSQPDLRAKLSVLHVAAEAHPLIKTGGLGDVAAALPAAQRSLGADARLLVPGFPAVLDALGLNGSAPDAIRIGSVFGAPDVRLLSASMPGTDLPLLVVHCPWFYERTGSPYTDESGNGWPDNHLRFALLGWIGAHLANGELITGWHADVLHAHDWHAGLALSYLAQNPASKPTRVFTIHNLAYQGRFPLQDASLLMLRNDLLTPDRLEFHGDLSFMKAGIDGAHHVTTVSPNYAREVLTPRFGEGLDGMLKAHADRLTGILNGIDTQTWDPGQDPGIIAHYSAGQIDSKVVNKRALLDEHGLNGETTGLPLIGVVSRLTAQKGQDDLVSAIEKLAGKRAQFVVLGTGDSTIESALDNLSERFSGSVSFVRGFDERLAHRIFAGCDMTLVPSHFEPCGLTQLYGLRYGCIPIVRAVGGLADTVTDVNADPALGNGFTFRESREFVPTIKRACDQFQNRQGWRKLVNNAMRADHDWQQAAAQYLRLYTGQPHVPVGAADATNGFTGGNQAIAQTTATTPSGQLTTAWQL